MEECLFSVRNVTPHWSMEISAHYLRVPAYFKRTNGMTEHMTEFTSAVRTNITTFIDSHPSITLFYNLSNFLHNQPYHKMAKSSFVGYKVEEDYSAEDFNPIDLEECTKPKVNAIIIYYLQIYSRAEHQDVQLWQYFREDFAQWTAATFAVADSPLVREFRDFLRLHGCYVPHEGKPSEELAKLVLEKEQHKWTTEEIQNLKEHTNGQFYSRWNPKPVLRDSHLGVNTSESQRQQAATGSANQQPYDSDYRTSRRDTMNFNPGDTPPDDTGSGEPAIQQQPRENLPHHGATGTPREPGVPAGPPEGDGQQPPKSYQRNLLIDLMKIYNNDKIKYGGEMYDFIEVKLRIFYDYCTKIGIPDEDLHVAFSIMLKDRAYDFYYQYVEGRGEDFSTMVAMSTLR